MSNLAGASLHFASRSDEFVTDRDVSLSEGTGTATSLLRRALGRDPQAWERLVTLYGPLVYHWCRRWGLQPRDADTVGQEVFLRVSQHLEQFHHEAPGSSFRAWLYRITRNCWIDFLRQEGREVAAVGGSDVQALLHSIPAEESDDSDVEERNEENALLYRRAIELIRSEFSQRDWMAFERVVLGGQSPTEVAAELAVSVNVVYLSKSRVLRRLRDEFDELLDC